MEIGYPRCDHFFWSQENLICFIKEKEPETLDILNQIKKYKKIIIYLPTFREKADNDLRRIIDFDLLEKKLREKNYLLIVKQHPNIRLSKENNYKNIILLKSTMDVYLIIPFTDVLITDYSSVLFDYILLKKPIILFPYDKENYLYEEKGFYFDYMKLNIIGDIVDNFEDLIKKIFCESYICRDM